MAKLTSKEREIILQELEARIDEIVHNETVELGGEYTKADVNTLRRGIDKLDEIFETLYE